MLEVVKCLLCYGAGLFLLSQCFGDTEDVSLVRGGSNNRTDKRK